MKVVYKGPNDGTYQPGNELFIIGKIYKAVLDNDSNGDFYQLFNITNGLHLDWCELDEVDILADIREQRIDDILNDETL